MTGNHHIISNYGEFIYYYILLRKFRTSQPFFDPDCQDRSYHKNKHFLGR